MQNEIDTLRLSEHITDNELNEAIEEFERFRDEINQQGFLFVSVLSLFTSLFQKSSFFKILFLFMTTHLLSHQNFGNLHISIAFSEIESMLAYEEERLEDLASGYNSVLCPRCQV